MSKASQALAAALMEANKPGPEERGRFVGTKEYWDEFSKQFEIGVVEGFKFYQSPRRCGKSLHGLKHDFMAFDEAAKIPQGTLPEEAKTLAAALAWEPPQKLWDQGVASMLHGPQKITNESWLALIEATP